MVEHLFLFQFVRYFHHLVAVMVVRLLAVVDESFVHLVEWLVLLLQQSSYNLVVDPKSGMNQLLSVLLLLDLCENIPSNLRSAFDREKGR